ncbi:MAG: hypothetical protein ABIT38_04735 [Gemmatimonadaceae bacterium]
MLFWEWTHTGPLTTPSDEVPPSVGHVRVPKQNTTAAHGYCLTLSHPLTRE